MCRKGQSKQFLIILSVSYFFSVVLLYIYISVLRFLFLSLDLFSSPWAGIVLVPLKE